jgi:hypothetical protein
MDTLHTNRGDTLKIQKDIREVSANLITLPLRISQFKFFHLFHKVCLESSSGSLILHFQVFLC